jgi:hypothetical protein
MVNRLKLILDQQEFEAIYQIARKELRNPADQVRYMLRCELQKRGLLTNEQETAVPCPSKKEVMSP